MPHTTRRQAIKRISVAGTIGIAGLAGCTSSLPGGSGPEATSGDLSSFKVGVLGPLTGPFAGWGQAEIAGAELAKRDLESEFDINIEMVTADTETSPSAGLRAMKRLVTSDGINFAQGGVSSAVCLKMGAWASENGVSYIASGASDTLTGSACEKYMYAVYSSNTMQAQAAAPKMAKQTDKWYILYSDYTWGHTGQDVISKALEENGASVVAKDAVPFPADDFTRFLNKIANTDATGVALIVPGLGARLAMKQLMNRGMHKSLSIMMHQFEDLVLWGLGKEAASALDTSPMGWSPSLDGVDQFNQRVAEHDDTDPFVRHYMGYTSMDQHVRAAIRAGSTNADAIRQELEGYEISGPVSDLQPGKMYWRGCDHQLVQPVHTVVGRPVNEMQDDPYKAWFEVTPTTPGDTVIRSCDATGCVL